MTSDMSHLNGRELSLGIHHLAISESITMGKRAILYLAAVGAITAIVHAQTDVEENKPLHTVAGNINDFANDFYQQLAKSQSGSLISSPLSVAIVLALLAYGAAGSTAVQLRSALHQSADDATTKQGYQSLIETLNQTGDVDVRLANKLFIDNRIELKKDYQELTQEVFHSEVENVKFLDTTTAAKIINDWAAAKTADKILNLVKPSDVDGALAVIANAVYFKGNWRIPFNEKLTKLEDFHVSSCEKMQVHTMFIKTRLYYGTVPGINARFVELPYQETKSQNTYNLILIVPNKINGLKNVEANWNSVKLSDLSGEIRTVDLHLPKFKIESSFQLEPILKQLGVTDIFLGSANFQGISSTPLKISKVIQKAYINLNENGTEAAAVTAAIGVVTSVPSPTTIVELKVNRPFYYAIVYGDGRTILFEGRVTLPKV